MVKEIYKSPRDDGAHFQWRMSWICEETQLTKNMIDENSIRVVEQDECDPSNPNLMGTDEKYLCFKTTYGTEYKVPATHIKNGNKIKVSRRKNIAMRNWD
jgi:hypothetical protein